MNPLLVAAFEQFGRNTGKALSATVKQNDPRVTGLQAVHEEAATIMSVLDPRLSFQACYTRLCTYDMGGLWQGDARGLKGFFQRSFRVLVLSVRGLIVNRSLIRASALAYLTGLAMIPIMALLFTILKSLGIQRLLAEPLMEHLAPGSKEFGMRIPALHREHPGGLPPRGFRHCGAAGRPDHADDQHRVGLQRHLAGGPHPAGWRRKLSDYLSIFLIFPCSWPWPSPSPPTS